MFNAEKNERYRRQVERSNRRTTTLVKQFVLENYVKLLCDPSLQAILLESEMDVMERGELKWISIIIYYPYVAKKIQAEIFANFEQWVVFRDFTGVSEVEIFTRPFTDPEQCLIRVDLKSLGGWNDAHLSNTGLNQD